MNRRFFGGKLEAAAALVSGFFTPGRSAKAADETENNGRPRKTWLNLFMAGRWGDSGNYYDAVCFNLFDDSGRIEVFRVPVSSSDDKGLTFGDRIMIRSVKKNKKTPEYYWVNYSVLGEDGVWRSGSVTVKQGETVELTNWI